MIQAAGLTHASEHRRSITNPEEFWAEQARHLHWMEPPKKILSRDPEGHFRWFEGGKLNTCALALDHHVDTGRGDQLALIYDSPVTQTVQKLTYKQLLDRTATFAGALRDLGVGHGDRVIIYMPMIPEAAIAMLACARIGAIHSVVFGGFAPHELAMRIDDATPKLIITASCGIEPSHVIPYKPLVDRAIVEAGHKPEHVVLFQRPQARAEMVAGRDHDWNEIVAKARPVAPVAVDAWDPLYILYTSGTTGKPKGIVRDNGGHAVALKYSMRTVYDMKPGDTFWAASDVGWVVGHSYIVYAPLLQGCTTVLYEGKPIKTPDAGAFWRVISEHKVNALFCAPTAMRAIRKEDPDGELKKKHDLTGFRTLFQAGERLDSATYEWAHQLLGVPVIDNWWQTETGWPIVANPLGLERFSPKPGSATKPVPGYDVQILDEEGHPVPAGKEGAVAIKLPLPPGCLPTLWKNEPRFRAGYLEKYPGFYLSGDGGIIDEDGYVFILGRIDDVINVAGHRLSTGEMEELCAQHPSVAECAVVGVEDDYRGQLPVALVVVKEKDPIDEMKLEAELSQIIRENIGPIACFKMAVKVARLPKTRSGKILRATIRKIADAKEYTVPSTIEDPAVLDEVKAALHKRHIGHA